MLIKVEGKYYISAESTYADDRVLIVNEADTFGVFDRWGDIHPIGKEVLGLYHEGTRFVSLAEFRLNEKRPVLLSSDIKEENELIHADLTNHDVREDGEVTIPKGTIHVNKRKFVRNGICYESYTITNFGQKTHEFKISFDLDADFRDIFEVRGIKREKRGKVEEVKTENGEIILGYVGLDNIKRTTRMGFSPRPDSIKKKKAVYTIRLEAKKSCRIEVYMIFKIGDKCVQWQGYKNALDQLVTHLRKSNEQIADIRTYNESFNHWIKRSRSDLVSLLAETPHGRYPYAGVPWYNTAFGRDGIITAYQSLWVAPEIARGVLYYLAKTQATEEVAEKDAEPGKIFHETRGGEMADLEEVPFKLYYGTIDATPLFVMLAGAYYKRTADIETMRRLWPNIKAAIQWMDNYGDIDNDGFIEYIIKSEKGLTNQGWKDSWDSVFYENGELAKPPIALCEVQGYVYCAKKNAAMLAEELGHHDVVQKLKREAEELKKRFNEAFWDEQLKTFIIALDGNKKPCRVNASNAGHCLFTGIANEENAKHLAQTLLNKNMFSGWGIRTVSTNSPRYNPLSYHNGSVWPHDTSLIAYGLSKYGFHNEVNRIMEGMFESSNFFESHRLPELFCGFDRRPGVAPVDYPVACSPQAWAIASLYMMLQASLRLEIDAVNKKLYFNKPSLPETINKLSIGNLLLGKEKAMINIESYHTDVGINVLKKEEDWEVIIIK